MTLEIGERKEEEKKKGSRQDGHHSICIGVEIQSLILQYREHEILVAKMTSPGFNSPFLSKFDSSTRTFTKIKDGCYNRISFFLDCIRKLLRVAKFSNIL